MDQKVRILIWSRGLRVGHSRTGGLGIRGLRGWAFEDSGVNWAFEDSGALGHSRIQGLDVGSKGHTLDHQLPGARVTRGN